MASRLGRARSASLCFAHNEAINLVKQRQAMQGWAPKNPLFIQINELIGTGWGLESGQWRRR